MCAEEGRLFRKEAFGKRGLCSKMGVEVGNGRLWNEAGGPEGGAVSCPALSEGEKQPGFPRG